MSDLDRARDEFDRATADLTEDEIAAMVEAIVDEVRAVTYLPASHSEAEVEVGW